jgi:phosphatidylserine decarboxylase
MKTDRLRRLLANEDLNFLLTNRLPRTTLTRLMGWFSRIRSPLLARVSIAIWRLFTDLDLSDARQQRFESLHACFTRELVAGARPIDPDPQALVSPCDGIVGACGPVEGTTLWQAKGLPMRCRTCSARPRTPPRFTTACTSRSG